MVKNNLYTGIAAFITCTLLLCSCVSSISVNPIVGQVEQIDYSVDGEPEVVQKVEQKPKEITIEQKKQNLISIYSSYIGAREKTGKNDGPEIKMFLAHEGLDEGFAWCAAFVSFCLDSAGFENTINAWSPTAHNRDALIYNKGEFVGTPEPGHVFTIYYPRKKRIGHTGFYNGWASKNIMQTVEGNTNDRKSREGDGVYVILRPINTIHSISSWYGQ